jgi:aminoglycoside phosphotransferase (APT) family kinase protein
VPEWDAEVEVDEELARALISERFPELDASSLCRTGIGWDNTVWATGDGVAFRFPRREIAVPGVRREIALLPALASRLPTAIPDAAYAVTEGDARFPWPWFGSRLIDGEELAVAGLDDTRREALATDLGRFLRRLHGLRPPAAERLPVDPLGRADMTRRVPRARAALRAIATGDDERLNDRAEAVLAAGETHARSDANPVLVHGDLHVRHLLVSAPGRLAGVIDWGDICRAPRAVDLSLYWSAFPAPARVAFRAAYGPLGDDTLVPARVLALFLCATLAGYARDVAMRELEQEALRGLERTLAD